MSAATKVAIQTVDDGGWGWQRDDRATEEAKPAGARLGVGQQILEEQRERLVANGRISRVQQPPGGISAKPTG